MCQCQVDSKGLTRYWPHCRACQYWTTFGLGCCSLCSPRLLRPLHSGPCLNYCCDCFHQISASDSSQVFHHSILFAQHWLCQFFAGQSWPKLATTVRMVIVKIQVLNVVVSNLTSLVFPGSCPLTILDGFAVKGGPVKSSLFWSWTATFCFLKGWLASKSPA